MIDHPIRIDCILPNTPGKKYPNKTSRPEITAIIALDVGKIFFNLGIPTT
jgi:hypothetical protein